MYRKGFLTSALLLGLSGSLMAQGTGTPLGFERTEGVTRVGTRGANFLEIGVGARAQALGGAFTALAEGTGGLYWNTAATALTEGFTASFSYSELYQGSDITHNFAGALVPTPFGTVGASVIHLSSGQMIRTTEEFPLGGDPEFGDVFEYTATAIGMHFGRRITDRLSVGFAGKAVSEGITGATASYVGVDLSTLFDTGLYGITVGATLANLGSKGRMTGRDVRTRLSPGQSEELLNTRRRLDGEILATALSLPTTFRFGIMTDLVGSARAILGPNPQHSLVLLTDFSDAITTDLQTSIALEYSFNELVFLRGGKKWLNESRADHRDDFGMGLAAGGGVRIPLGNGRRLMFDYAYANQNDLNYNQIFSVEISF